MSNKAKQYTAIGIGVIILFSIGMLYSLGYRFTESYSIGKMGTLLIQTPLTQTVVIIDKAEKIVTTTSNQNVAIKLSPRTHEVLIAREGYFPWVQDVSIPSGGNATVTPLFVSQNPSGQIITQVDPEYWDIRNKVESHILPTKEASLVSLDTTTRLWVTDNAIMFQVGTSTPRAIIQPDTIVKNVAFYKDRSDAVIFSTANGIYVIEREGHGTQNFMPLYKGASPIFIKTNSQFIYIWDNNALMQVVI